METTVRAALPPREYPENIKPYQLRVLLFDPAPVYERLNVDHYKRTQSLLMEKMFPKLDDTVCGCGCGQQLTGRRKRWASEDCVRFVNAVYNIITGAHNTVKFYLTIINDGYNCCECGGSDNDYPEGWYDNKNNFMSWIHKDHIVAVKNGGGGCWLANYQLLCHNCHAKKSRRDFIRKDPELKLELPNYPINPDIF